MKRLIWIFWAGLLLPLNAAYGQMNEVECQQFSTSCGATNVESLYQIEKDCKTYYNEVKLGLPTAFTFAASDATGFDAFNNCLIDWQVQAAPFGGSLPDAQQVITNYIDMLQQMGSAGAKPPVAIGGNWNQFGPDQATPAGERGRLEFVTFAPQSPSFMLTGSPVGGVWFSDNGGASWQNGGMDSLPQVSAHDCLVHPTNIDVWFCATGGSWTQSYGVYRTVNAGATWEFINLNMMYWGYQIHELIFKPDDPNTIYAATTSGVWQTTNAMAPAGSVTWNQLNINPGGSNNVNILDMKFQPGSSKNMYASGAILVQSTNAGGNWTTVPGTTFIGPNLEGMAMAVTPANPKLLYLVLINTDQAYVYLNTDGFNNGPWVPKGPVQNTASYGSPSGVRLGDERSLAVSPTDADLVYIGNVGTARCLNGTDYNPCNWVSVQTGYIHADIREIRFSPDGTTVWAATDGGLFESTPSNNSWTDQNYGIGVATILGFDAAATDPSVVLIGQYDNGTALSSDSGTWNWVNGGDGMQPMIDYTNLNNMYASDQFNLWRSANGGQDGFPYYATCPAQPTWNLFSVLNTMNPDIFFAACMEVQRTPDQGVTWTLNPLLNVPEISNWGWPLIWRVYAAPSNPDYLYAWALDIPPHSGTTDVAHLYRTENANCNASGTCDSTGIPTWTEIALPAYCGHPAAFPSGLAVDPENPNQFYVAYGGYCAAPRVFEYICTNLACTTQKFVLYDAPGDGLPPVSIDSIVVEPGPSGYVFVGSFAGVYYTTDGVTWTQYGNLLPDVQVRFLKINCTANLMYAATFGRGVWTIPLSAIGTCPLL